MLAIRIPLILLSIIGSLFCFAKLSADEATQDQKTAKVEAVDRFQLPEGGVKELFAFFTRLRAGEPGMSNDDYEKKTVAMIAAGHKIKELATEGDRQSKDYNRVIGTWLYIRVWRKKSSEEQKQLLEDIKAHLADREPLSITAEAAACMISHLHKESPQQAAGFAAESLAILAKNKHEQATYFRNRIDGTLRLLSLMGKSLDIRGTTIDGEKFDLATLRGKVVLVEFWTSWCSSCRLEFPNLMKNYELYHERGFEIVGIGLDNQHETLKEYLTEHQRPWITLYDGPWMENPNAIYYGIVEVTTQILIDRDGKAVSTDARGPELGKQLARLLGEVEQVQDLEPMAAK